MPSALRRNIAVDLDQYDAITEYINITGATRACVVREAVATWLRNEKQKRMAAFGLGVPKKSHRKAG